MCSVTLAVLGQRMIYPVPVLVYMVFHLSVLLPIIFWVILSFCLPHMYTDFSFLPNLENFDLVIFYHAHLVLVF